MQQSCLQKPTALRLRKQFPAFYGTRRLITVFARLQSTSPRHILKLRFNIIIILPSTPKFSYWCFSFRFYTHRRTHFTHSYYMSRPSQNTPLTSFSNNLQDISNPLNFKLVYSATVPTALGYTLTAQLADECICTQRTCKAGLRNLQAQRNNKCGALSTHSLTPFMMTTPPRPFKCNNHMTYFSPIKQTITSELQ